MKSTVHKSFITGSYAYGIPRVDSDIDLVVFVSAKDLERLQAQSEPAEHTEEYIHAGGIPVRYGKLNVICCANETYFEIWRKGTMRLKKQSPVTREFAVEYFRRLRQEAGFSVLDPKPQRRVTDPTPRFEDDIPY